MAAKAAGYVADKGRDPRLLKSVAWTEILVATAPTDAPPGPTRPSRSPPRDPALPRASPALPRRRDDTARSAAHLEDESGHGPGPQEQRPGPACRSPWRGRRGAWPRQIRASPFVHRVVNRFRNVILKIDVPAIIFCSKWLDRLKLLTDERGRLQNKKIIVASCQTSNRLQNKHPL